MSEHIEARKAELHDAITTAMAIEKRILELHRDGAPLTEIGVLIEERAQFERTAGRLNVEIAAEVQALNLQHFLNVVDRYDAARASEYQEIRALLLTNPRVERLEERADGHDRDIASLRARMAALEALHDGAR